MLPILFQSDSLILYSYPLFMGLGWGIAYQIFFSLIPENYPRKYAQFLFWGVFLCAWVGAKLLFLMTLPEGVGTGLVSETSFWTGGGFVFYGGLIAGALFVFAFRLNGFPLDDRTFWAIVPALTLGHAIGRVGCFLAGCCFGKETDWWWSIHLHGADRHPTQLIEALGLFILGIYLLKSRKDLWLLASHYLVGYGLLRLLVESLRGDMVRGEWGMMSPSQWISLILVALGGFVLTPYFRNLKLLK